MNPRRIQRKRTKGWRMPDGAIYVGRPTRWGNPFPLNGGWITWAAVGMGYRGDAEGRRAACVALYCAWVTHTPVQLGPLHGSTDGGALVFPNGSVVSMADHARGFAAAAAAFYDPPGLPDVPPLQELRGRDLACWCPLDQPCHSDVLLRIANEVSR